MDGSIWIVLVVSAALFGVIIYFSMKKHKQLVSEGRIISRRTDFMENAEEFTLTAVDPARVTEGVRNMDYAAMHTGMKGSSEQQRFDFTGNGWSARLVRLSADEAKTVYRFAFTGWKTRNGLPQDALNMNQLTTAVEKLFFSLDPNTLVREVPLELKTKHSIL